MHLYYYHNLKLFCFCYCYCQPYSYSYSYRYPNLYSYIQPYLYLFQFDYSPLSSTLFPLVISKSYYKDLYFYTTILPLPIPQLLPLPIPQLLPPQPLLITYLIIYHYHYLNLYRYHYLNYNHYDLDKDYDNHFLSCDLSVAIISNSYLQRLALPLLTIILHLTLRYLTLPKYLTKVLFQTLWYLVPGACYLILLYTLDTSNLLHLHLHLQKSTISRNDTCSNRIRPITRVTY